MRVYLDVSCLNRPFDDQGQNRIRLESEAVTIILDMFDQGRIQQVSSVMALVEIDANPDPIKRRRVRSLLPDAGDIIDLSAQAIRRAGGLLAFGFKAADALHLAAAEQAQADVFLSCDDRLCRLAARRKLNVKVANPVTWLQELQDATNS